MCIRDRFKHIHVAYSYRVIEAFTCSSVSELKFSRLRITALVQKVYDVFFSSAVKDRGRYIPAFLLGRKTQVDFKYLSYVCLLYTSRCV